MTVVYLNDLGICCALGANADAVFDNMMAGNQSGMVATDSYSPGHTCFVGSVSIDLPPIPGGQRHFESRNNRLLLAALEQIARSVDDAKRRWGADRIGVVLGTSTSGIAEGEQAVIELLRTGTAPSRYDYRQQRLSAGSDFLAAHLGVSGPSSTVSTACSSSAHALASARRLINAGFCDAVIAGGADTLSALTVRGFRSLDSLSDAISNPLSVNRDGINIGEGVALFLMTREPPDTPIPVALLGSGASVDAHHISSPDPTGSGAVRAMRAALADAELDPMEIDYVNLHGTGTPLNDAMEARAVNEVFGLGVPCSSTKPLTGHTLGAAGAIEAALCWLALSHRDARGEIPPHRWDGQRDPDLPALPVTRIGNIRSPLKRCLTNSFAFGGNNASLIVGQRA